MKAFLSRLRVRPFLEAAVPYVDGYLFVLSMAYLALILSTQFVPPAWLTIPVPMHWIVPSVGDLLIKAQEFIWGSFASVFLLYGLTSSRRLWRYTSRFWLEAVVLASTWVTFSEGMLIQQVHNLVSLQTLGLMGGVAHFLRILRWLARRSAKHSWAVLALATIAIITVAAAVLMVVEPDTFRSFPDAAFEMSLTATTNGGKLLPLTTFGRAVYLIFLVCLVTVWAVYQAVVREHVHEWMTKQRGVLMQLLEEVRTLITEVRTMFGSLRKVPAAIGLLLVQTRKLQEEVRLLRDEIKELRAERAASPASSDASPSEPPEQARS